MHKEIESNLSKQMQQVVNRLFRKFCYSIYFAVLFFINGLLLSECRAGLRADTEQDKRSYFKSHINRRENEATFSVSSHDSNTKKNVGKNTNVLLGYSLLSYNMFNFSGG